MSIERLFHVTLMSNFARAYDKYARSYSKKNIPESRYPDRFFLLRPEELAIGIAKTTSLLERTRVVGDRHLVLETHMDSEELRPNTDTNLGRYIERDWIDVDALHSRDADGTQSPISPEEACAESMRLLTPSMAPFAQLRPRSISLLPVAIGCQAACPFCFSRASASAEQSMGSLDFPRIRSLLRSAQQLGADRAVITGGGEPGMLRFERLVALVRECALQFRKVVLITNGYSLAKLTDTQRAESLKTLADAGLSVLAISRHHHDADANASLMGLHTGSEWIANTLENCREELGALKLRWICVLQSGGIDSDKSIAAFLDWSASCGVNEVCFKELYVSTSQESVYHDYAANQWSHRHQVPLRLVLRFAKEHAWTEIARLPWGSPIFETSVNDRPLRVAAYTEPSLFWERSHRIARSWNVMADGRCLASLEDRASEVG